MKNRLLTLAFVLASGPAHAQDKLALVGGMLVDGYEVPPLHHAAVLIDVTLPDELPPSARTDLTIDGTVEIERLEDVIYVGRPAYGNANSRVGIFKLVEDGNYAERMSVQLGASSVNEIEIREGLQPGDVVILSPMDQWDGYDRVRLRG